MKVEHTEVTTNTGTGLHLESEGKRKTNSSLFQSIYTSFLYWWNAQKGVKEKKINFKGETNRIEKVRKG